MCQIKIVGLSKCYRQFYALKDINLQIGAGLFGLLGPNGAGKTTLMKIISTILPYEEGKVMVDEFDVAKDGEQVREMLGYLPQHFYTPTQFTGREFLHYVGSMKGLVQKSEREEQVEKLLKQVNLLAYADKKIKGYSGGMVRRLGIAQALLGNPKLLIFDEPTAGLDPSERIRFRNVIEKLSKNHTIILSTHIMSDIESSCENVAVMNRGKLLYQGTTTSLREKADNYVWELSVPAAAYDKVEAAHIVVASRREMDNIIFRVISKEAPSADAVATQPTIEDGYMAMIHGVIV